MKKDRLLEILNKFNDIKIAVVGDMMLDDYIERNEKEITKFSD